MKLVRQSQTTLTLSLILWLLVVGVGIRLVLKYDNESGKTGLSPSSWPVISEIARSSKLPTLVMMVHPQCPCSRASISELEILMAEETGRVNAEVVFVKPNGFPEKWEQTDLWQSATLIPGVAVRVDDGTEARRFGSLTSGQVMLYSANGELLFSGGITASRGHLGDNDGRSSIQSLLANGSSEINNTPVFGCPLFNDDSSNTTRDALHANQSN